MGKNYTFSDCVSFAISNNIAFNFYYYDADLHYLYSDISDGIDGYLTATRAVFEYDNFSKTYNASMDLNIRHAYKKDYELMRRLEIAINKKDGMKHLHAHWNHGITLWYGALCLNNEHYIAEETIHGKSVWR